MTIVTDELIIIKTTLPDEKSAMQLSKALIEQAIAACAQITKIQSVYKWEGAVEDAIEYEVSIKTMRSMYQHVQRCINKHHPYKIPQIIALPVNYADTRYLEWVKESLMQPK